MFKNFLYILVLTFIITSCTQTFDSVKRGITGAKSNSTDEFLVRKKDPLILPPEFNRLPIPDEPNELEEEITAFEKKMKKKSSTDSVSSSDTSTEQSILKKIQKD